MSAEISVANYYDNMAGEYDTHIEAMSWTDRTMLGNLLDDLALENVEGGSTLDLGAGTGYSFEAVAERYTPGRAVAVDVSTGMLAQYSERYQGRFPIQVVEANMLDYLQVPLQLRTSASIL